MPSPFPGMDPYLESPDWFPDLHGSLIIFMKGTLQRSLPESYYAQSSQRVWLEYTQRHIEPDVEIVQSAAEAAQAEPRRRSGLLAEPQAGGPLVVTVETIEHGPFKQSFLEIRRRRGKEVQIVTSIEILSPSNKKIGHPGAREVPGEAAEDPRQRDSPGRDRPAPRRDAHRWPSPGISSRHRPARSITWSRSIDSIDPRSSSSIRSR